MRELRPPDCVLEYFSFTLNEDDSEMLILSSGCRGEHAGPPFQSSPESTKDPAAVDEKLEHLGMHTQEGVCGLEWEKSPESMAYSPPKTRIIRPWPSPAANLWTPENFRTPGLRSAFWGRPWTHHHTCQQTCRQAGSAFLMETQLWEGFLEEGEWKSKAV